EERKNHVSACPRAGCRRLRQCRPRRCQESRSTATRQTVSLALFPDPVFDVPVPLLHAVVGEYRWRHCYSAVLVLDDAVALQPHEQAVGSDAPPVTGIVCPVISGLSVIRKI